MRSGWRVMLAWLALLVAVGLLGWAVPRPPNWLFGTMLGAAYTAWIGMGVTAAVMLSRGAGTRYGWAVEAWVLRAIATLGLLPVFYVLMIAVFGWNN